ncbi:MAG TPA: hypothetical protein VHR55_02120 [Candidatus Limnocylindria bacterium]|nr:hypothetical protein [Candidatus Limnocylindria bacterium]
MLIPNHPDDERLAALASADADATADAELTSHVASCARCAETVTELGALRAALADLPDLRPHRPLRLLTDATDAADAPAPGGADRLARWVRRVFAPVVTAGAALAMVGLVGTTAPLLGAGAGGAAPAFQDAAQESAGGADAGGEGVAAPAASETDERNGEEGEVMNLNTFDDRQVEAGRDGDALTTLPAERSPWPMVLFSGVALVVFALLLRWIVVPRAG